MERNYVHIYRDRQFVCIGWEGEKQDRERANDIEIEMEMYIK